MGCLMVYTESSHVQQFFELHPGDRQQLASGPIITASCFSYRIFLVPFCPASASCCKKMGAVLEKI